LAFRSNAESSKRSPAADHLKRAIHNNLIF
jgi:hypothetical protein